MPVTGKCQYTLREPEGSCRGVIPGVPAIDGGMKLAPALRPAIRWCYPADPDYRKPPWNLGSDPEAAFRKELSISSMVKCETAGAALAAHPVR